MQADSKLSARNIRHTALRRKLMVVGFYQGPEGASWRQYCKTDRILFRMEIIFTTLLLFGTAGALALLRIWRPRFRFGWLVAVAGSAGAWLSVWSWLPRLPVQLDIPLWQSAASADSYATFLVTGISWPYALSLTTLACAYVLSAPARAGFHSPSSWALSLAVVGLGLLGTAAESPLTLVLFWASLDLVEAGIVLARPEGQTVRLHWPLTLTLRLGSMALVLLGLVLGQAGGSDGSFGSILGVGAVLLPAAGLLRLAALAIPGDPASNQDALRVVVHLTAGATAVAFLAQLSSTGHSGSVLLGFVCACVALFAGWMWLRGPDVAAALPLWLMGIGSLAVAVMLRGNPVGATAWGNAMLLAGSPLFLARAHDRWANRALLPAILICSGLPLTLTAAVWTTGGLADDLLLPALLLAQAALLAGFYHFARSANAMAPLPATASSLRGFYRAGITFPVVVGLALGFWGASGALHLDALAAAGFAMVAAVALGWGKRRIGLLTPSPLHWTPRPAERLLSAVGDELTRLQDMLQRVAISITRALEGEAGILLSLVALVLLVSVIADRAR